MTTTEKPNADNPMPDGQDTSEAVESREELEALIAETEGVPPQEIVDPDLEKVARLNALIAPVHLLSAHTKVMIFGEQGSGKTKWSMTSPNPLLIAIEQGQKSLLNHDETNTAEVMQFKSVQQVEDIAYLSRLGKFGEAFETYSLDTYSELEKTALSLRVGEQWARNPALRDRYTPEGKDYQSSGEHMRQVAASFRDVPKNIIFVCQEQYRDGIYKPALPEKVLAKLGEYCDLVARLTADWSDPENPKFTLQTRRTPDVLAKSRIKNLPTFIEGSDFNLVHRANMAQIKKAAEKKGK